jgi:hypothetical protein
MPKLMNCKLFRSFTAAGWSPQVRLAALGAGAWPSQIFIGTKLEHQESRCYMWITGR